MSTKCELLVDCDDDNELQERRQAELDFVSAAYSLEEAWWTLEERVAGNATGSTPVNQKLMVAHVYRRLELQVTPSTTTATSPTDSLPIVLILSMPQGYPCHTPLQVEASLQESSSSSSSTSLIKAAYDALPKLVESCRQAALESLGEEALFTVLSHADQWLEEEWQKFYSNYTSSNDANKDLTKEIPVANTPIILGRRLIYSHHIIAKTKRSTIQSLASQLRLTGYMKIGWPGLILIEGREEDCVDFYDEIRPMSWQYLVVRGEQQECVESLDELESKRGFSSFQEVDDMSIVAQHCRDVGLEALFKTSMKVYAESSPTLSSTESQQPTLFGALVLVDHMNDAKNYRKWLRKTAGICDCHLLIKQCLLPSGERPSLIIVALVGNVENHAVPNMLKRWRTAKVDVDLRGKPCLERMMTVLIQGVVDSNVAHVLDWKDTHSEESLNVSSSHLQEMLMAIGGSKWQEAFQTIL